MVQRFVKPAVEVEAVQYCGKEDLHKILDWLGGVIYVEQGMEHEHRFAAEYEDNLIVKLDAPAFIVIKTRNGYDRADVGDWIVRYDALRVSVYDQLDFAVQFEELVNHE